MSSETLREAAALMRARAEAAGVLSGAAWSVHRTGYTVIDGSGLDVGTVATEPEAEHIASWDPTVALAVADLLEQEAHAMAADARHQEMDATYPWYNGARADALLAVATAYLGAGR